MSDSRRPAADVPHAGGPPTLDLDDLITLVRAAKLVRRHLDTQVLYRNHLTWTSWDVLQLIVRRPGISSREIADIAVLSKSGITKICDALTDHRLVNRSRVQDDKRLVEVYPTARGSRLVDDMIPQLTETYDRYIATGTTDVGPDFRALLRALFLPDTTGQGTSPADNER